ncbi:unnamed protein product [Clonostachys rhizophaga]|uniref:Uncharacterized protein n=1 Tax=Clonostachys rhizophaga TaxID=160324 RepID=A0A9N9V5J3_9HYPO|nr:unnamed protein product [Clonostachys rhizophaga]
MQLLASQAAGMAKTGQGPLGVIFLVIIMTWLGPKDLAYTVDRRGVDESNIFCSVGQPVSGYNKTAINSY